MLAFWYYVVHSVSAYYIKADFLSCHLYWKWDNHMREIKRIFQCIRNKFLHDQIWTFLFKQIKFGRLLQFLYKEWAKIGLLLIVLNDIFPMEQNNLRPESWELIDKNRRYFSLKWWQIKETPCTIRSNSNFAHFL